MKFLKKVVVAKSAGKLEDLLKKAASATWKKDFLEELPDGLHMKDMLDGKLEELFSNIRSNAKYKGGRLVVHRCLSATVEEFLKSKAVGDHWTFDESNIHCWEQGSQDKSKWIVLEGTIALKDVYPEETLHTNLSFDHETEVTLRGGGSASIERIVSFKDRKKVLKEFDPPLVKKN